MRAEWERSMIEGVKSYTKSSKMRHAFFAKLCQKWVVNSEFMAGDHKRMRHHWISKGRPLRRICGGVQ